MSRLEIAEWLGHRLPFAWAPRWLNHKLARWMWSTPGFDVSPPRENLYISRWWREGERWRHFECWTLEQGVFVDGASVLTADALTLPQPTRDEYLKAHDAATREESR